MNTPLDPGFHHPLQSCSVPQASLASSPINTNTHFASIHRQVSPTMTGRAPGHLSRLMRCLDINAL